jgi:hypothetical protein
MDRSRMYFAKSQSIVDQIDQRRNQNFSALASRSWDLKRSVRDLTKLGLADSLDAQG